MTKQAMTTDQDNAHNLARLIDHRLEAIKLEHARLTDENAQHHKYDIEFYLVALVRLERCAERALHRLDRGAKIRTAIDDFQNRLEGYDHLRDLTEHMDEYVVGRGELQKTPGMAFIPGIYFSLELGEVRICHGKYQIVLSEATAAARQLHQTVHEVIDPQASAVLTP